MSEIYRVRVRDLKTWEILREESVHNIIDATNVSMDMFERFPDENRFQIETDLVK